MIILFAALFTGVGILILGVGFWAWIGNLMYQAGKYREIKRFEEFKAKQAALHISNVKAQPSFTIVYRVGASKRSGSFLGSTESEALKTFLKEAGTGYSSIIEIKKN